MCGQPAHYPPPPTAATTLPTTLANTTHRTRDSAAPLPIAPPTPNARLAAAPTLPAPPPKNPPGTAISTSVLDRQRQRHFFLLFNHLSLSATISIACNHRRRIAAAATSVTWRTKTPRWPRPATGWLLMPLRRTTATGLTSNSTTSPGSWAADHRSRSRNDDE